jgi:hypothetical protein
MRQLGKREVWISGEFHEKLRQKAYSQQRTLSQELDLILKWFFESDEPKTTTMVI